ncbi:MAG: hypothetical protein JNK82_32425, partial [Myxococcaceae bacterium]|nr:hypothetical protein [Myxococcaceae bacterium]
LCGADAPLLDSPAAEVEKVERRAAILSGVGIAFGLGGALAVAVGSTQNEQRMAIGGGLLIGVGVHALLLAVVAWLWPDDSWLGFMTDELMFTPPPR